MDLTTGDFNRDGKEDVLAISYEQGSDYSVFLNGCGFPVPYVTSFSPLSGPIGTKTVIKGSGFSSIATSNKVTFGGIEALVSGASDSSLTVIVPSGATYNRIVVEVNGLLASSNNSFDVTCDTCEINLFNGQQTYILGTNPTSSAIGDFNNDRNQDIVTACSNSNFLSVQLGTGKGTFTTPVTYPVGTTPRTVVVADFNGDGNQDIASVNQGASYQYLSVLTGLGTGSFGAQLVTNNGVESTSNLMASGDFNNDGNQDLVIASESINSISILLGVSNGYFFADNQNVNLQLVGNPYGLAVGDLNGDGNQDIVTANQNTNNVSVLTGTGTGSFGVMENYPVGISPYAVAIGDLNGDGNLDIVTANNISNNVSVLTSSGAGIFGTQVNYMVGSGPVGISIGDINSDGNPDIITANNQSNDISVLTGTGTGSFGPPLDYAAGSNPYSVTVGDFNNDGKQDIAVDNYNSNDVSILLNQCGIYNKSTSISYTGPNSGIVGNVLQLTATATSGVVPTFSIVSGGSLAQVSGQQLTLNQPGTVTISISVSSTSGYWGASIHQVLLIYPPVISVSGLSSTTVIPGQTVTVNGTDFLYATGVVLGNATLTSYTVINNNMISFAIPANITGTALSVQVENGLDPSNALTVSLTNNISEVVSTSTVVGATFGTTGSVPVSVNIPLGVTVIGIDVLYREVSSRSAMQSITATATGSTYTANLPLSAITDLGLEYLFEVTTSGETYKTDTLYVYLQYPNNVPFTNVVQTGKTVANYAILSFPYTFTNNSQGSVLSQLGSPDSTKWRMFGYSATASSYSEFLSSTDRYQLGQGYWLLTTLPVTELNSQAEVDNVTKGKPFSYRYDQGWNLIGNPYPFNILWSDITAANSGKNLPNHVYIYSAGTPNASSTIGKYSGAFLYLSDTATILFPVEKNPLAGARLSPNLSSLSNYSTGNDWGLSLNATNNVQSFGLAGIGMRSDALFGFDGYDVPLLPVPDGFLSLQVGNNMVDVVKDTTAYVWHFNVSGQGAVGLSWTLPSPLPLYLFDRSSNVTVDMRQQPSYQLLSSAKGFDIVYGSSLSENSCDVWVKLAPNPANDVLFITYKDDAPSTISLEMTDISGKRALVDRWQAGPGVGSQTLDVSQLNGGAYIVKVVSNKLNYYQKIIIQD